MFSRPLSWTFRFCNFQLLFLERPRFLGTGRGTGLKAPIHPKRTEIAACLTFPKVNAFDHSGVPLFLFRPILRKLSFWPLFSSIGQHYLLPKSSDCQYFCDFYNRLIIFVCQYFLICITADLLRTPGRILPVQGFRRRIPCSNASLHLALQHLQDFAESTRLPYLLLPQRFP